MSMQGDQGLDRVKVVIGLGNPEARYDGTRHNAGFAVLDLIAERLGLTWQRSGNAEWAHVSGEMVAGRHGHSPRVQGGTLALVKPLTYMNKSGDVVPALRKQGVEASEVLVVHDELEKALGYVGMRFDGSARGHNGLRSLIERMGKDFWRLRVGIDRPGPGVDVGDYVLGKFPPSERVVFEEAVIKAAQIIAKV